MYLFLYRHVQGIWVFAVSILLSIMITDQELSVQVSFCWPSLFTVYQEDYVKWRGPLFYRFVSVIVDEVDTVRDFGKIDISVINLSF